MGLSFLFTLHIRCISTARSLYFKIFSASFLMTFLSHKLQYLLTDMFSFINTECRVWFIVMDAAVIIIIIIIIIIISSSSSSSSSSRLNISSSI
jgi:hypothetical protein